MAVSPTAMTTDPKPSPRRRRGAEGVDLRPNPEAKEFQDVEQAFLTGERIEVTEMSSAEFGAVLRGVRQR
jgi:hypothetical protein